MDPLPPSTLRANRWLFAVLIVFAIALAVIVFLWMQGVVRANGGIADPQRQKTSLYLPNREPTARADFVLPTAVRQGRSQKVEGRSPARERSQSPGSLAFCPLPPNFFLLPSHF